MTASLNVAQEEKMRQMANFAYKHSPFYRHLYIKNNINPETAKLPDELPTVSQLDLINSALSFRTDVPAFKVCASSGTSGKPKLLFRTEEDFERSVANQIRLMQWSGVRPSDVVAIVQPFGLWGYGDLTQEASRRMGALALPIGMVSDEVALKLIKTVGATVLDVSPSRLRSLLRLSRKTTTDGQIKLHTIMLAGEPIPAGLQERVMQIWGARIFNHYGSEETDALGGSRACSGAISLFDDDFVFEFLTEEGVPLREGEVGQLVVTSLYHRGTPLIRYRLEDLVWQNGTKANEVEILGRVGEYALLYDSVKLYPYHIDYALQQLTNKVSGWQCIIENKINQVCITLNLRTLDNGTSCEKVQMALSKCNIDVEALVTKGDLVFTINLNTVQLVSTGRGKTPRFIDRRVESSLDKVAQR